MLLAKLTKHDPRDSFLNSNHDDVITSAYFLHSAVLSIGLFVGTLVVLVALIFKKNEAPTNFYLLLAFVSHSSINNYGVIQLYVPHCL